MLSVAGGVALAVTIPLIGFALAFRPWIQSTIKGELSDFKLEVTNQIKDATARLDRLAPFERYFEEQAHALKDKPNPPITRKNELLDKWHNQTLTYPESLELKGILEQESTQASETVRAIIRIALIGLGLYILTRE